MTSSASQFTGSIPEVYDRCLGPVFFQPHAESLAQLVPAECQDILELAAGTGILTRVLSEKLNSNILATDLNNAMLDILRSKNLGGHVKTEVADACRLPCEDRSFDTVICQFGFMFFPDKQKAITEAFRVLRPGGHLIFNVWDKIEHHPYVSVAMEVVSDMFASNPPKFYSVPFSCHIVGPIVEMLGNAGFVETRSVTVDIECPCSSTDLLVDGLISGNPISFELQELGPSAVAESRTAVYSKLKAKFGASPYSARTRAIQIEARKP